MAENGMDNDDSLGFFHSRSHLSLSQVTLCLSSKVTPRVLVAGRVIFTARVPR